MAKHLKFTNDVRLKIESYGSLEEKKEKLLEWMKETSDPKYLPIRRSVSSVNNNAKLTELMFMMQLKSEGMGVF